MSVPLGCGVCGVPLPAAPLTGIYCPHCGHFNGVSELPGPIIPGVDDLASMIPISEGSLIDIADTSKPPEIETDVPHFDAIEHGCEVRGRGVHVPRMVARLAVEGILFRIDDDLNPEMWMEVAISDELLLAFLPSILAKMPSEGVQEVREMLFHPE